MVFVAGEPVLLSRGEAGWREAVRGCGLTDLPSPHLRFVVTSWQRGGNRFDLDNLVDPVLAAIGARPSDRTSLWATVELGHDPGVSITDAQPPPAPASAVTVKPASAPRGWIRTTEPLAQLVARTARHRRAMWMLPDPRRRHRRRRLRIRGAHQADDRRALAPARRGTPRLTHRVRDLRISRDLSQTGVLVALWPLEDE